MSRPSSIIRVIIALLLLGLKISIKYSSLHVRFIRSSKTFPVTVVSETFDRLCVTFT
jgi:hypothetical protein